MPTDEQYRQVASEQYDKKIVDVTPEAPVSRTTIAGSMKHGAWVRAWIWVDDEDIPDQGQFGVGA